ncbi:transcriptional regulator [Janthinobacterium sp. GB4P2]|uniref:transcriptional regulator n=1 Tax=Janthinobacterium sp. GB4P2 TaxID=3424189 RepID=UPI003F265D42
MKLLDYLQVRGSQRLLAKQLGISPVLISQWANVQRPTPPDRCVEIEKATQGAVCRRDLRPDDWHRFWPELVTTKEAP